MGVLSVGGAFVAVDVGFGLCVSFTLVSLGVGDADGVGDWMGVGVGDAVVFGVGGVVGVGVVEEDGDGEKVGDCAGGAVGVTGGGVPVGSGAEIGVNSKPVTTTSTGSPSEGGRERNSQRFIIATSPVEAQLRLETHCLIMLPGGAVFRV